ncbi:MAG TPA: T9SS type A sorting domain-containing protein, partial [Chitinophagaceae bacterium]|nr:T9SS type A sorting domain-containing protein [Chitinophagaceae bacterium]
EGVKLTWSVSDEVNVSRYEIEKSEDGISFIKVAALPAVRLPSYAYNDYSPAEINFYRLKMVDMDGSEKKSSVIRVIIPRKSDCEIYPNPVSRRMFIECGVEFFGGELLMFDEEGRQVKQMRISSGLTSIDCSALKKGIYYVFCRKGQSVKWKMIWKE